MISNILGCVKWCLTCQKLRRIDFHAHQIRTYNLSEFIDSLVLFQLSSLIPEQILKKIMIVKDGLFGEVKGEEHVRLMEKVRNYEEAWNIQALAERLRRHLTSTPAFFDFLRYLAIIYDCKPLIPEIDDEIGDIHSENAGSYVRSVLDRENISWPSWTSTALWRSSPLFRLTGLACFSAPPGAYATLFGRSTTEPPVLTRCLNFPRV